MNTTVEYILLKRPIYERQGLIFIMLLYIVHINMNDCFYVQDEIRCCKEKPQHEKEWQVASGASTNTIYTCKKLVLAPASNKAQQVLIGSKDVTNTTYHHQVSMGHTSE